MASHGNGAPPPPHLEMLRRVTEHMAVGQGLDQVLASITQGLVQLAGMTTAGIWLWLHDAECDRCCEGPLVPPDQPSLERRIHRYMQADAPDFNRLAPGHVLAPTPGYIEGLRRERRFRLYHNVASIGDALESAVGRSSTSPAGVTWAAALERERISAGATFPLFARDDFVGLLFLLARRPISDEETRYLEVFALEAASAIRSEQLHREVERLRDRLANENAYLVEAVKEEAGFTGIVGTSRATMAVVRMIRQVAPADSTVLITGETGTGKELVARAIHQASRRSQHPLIKVNCAAMSAGLVESELFGHEKGAFTGAVQRRLGRFELADRGTLFLDEVGELPPETQVKLLRVLQEREFERVGGERPIRADVRVIAATNRDLGEEVAKGRFRSDLFYRLNVLPLAVPPLRERAEDIPALTTHFVAQSARNLGRRCTGVTPESLERLRRYRWPGNIRELQNVIERACVLGSGPVVDVPDPADSAGQDDGAWRPATLRAVERQHVLKTLEQTGWRVEGPAGAAAILGLNASTLRSRLRKLGIRRSPA